MVESIIAYSLSASAARGWNTRSHTPVLAQRLKRVWTLTPQPNRSGRSRQGGVWSRDEVVRVDLEGCRVLCPGLADGLEGGSPSQPLEVLGEVVGHDEGQDVGLQALQVGVVEDLDGPVLDGPVHPLGLAVRPGMI